jgi:hypothetical protein
MSNNDKIDETTLVEKWLRRLRNNKAIALIIVFGIVIISLAQFTKSINDIISPITKDKHPDIKPTSDSNMIPKKPDPPLVYFEDKFSLGERENKIIHGVSIYIGNIINDGLATYAEFGFIDNENIHSETVNTSKVRKGSELKVNRPGCAYIAISIDDVELYPKDGLTFEDLKKLGPAAEMFIVRKVNGKVSGRCAE